MKDGCMMTDLSIATSEPSPPSLSLEEILVPIRYSPRLKEGITDLEWAYVAGYFDGEGSISIHVAWPKNRPNPRYHINISVSQCSESVQRWMAETFGGTVSVLDRPSPLHRRQWRWDMRQSDAVAFITGIRPYLRVKHAQADLLLQFYARINPKNTKPLSDYEHDIRMGMAIHLRELNKGVA